MFIRQALNLVRGKARAVEADADDFVDRRIEARRPVFREAMLKLEAYYAIRAVITDVSESGARVAFSTRVDLPFRIVIIEPTLKLNCWARVVWQKEGVAGLELLHDA